MNVTVSQQSYGKSQVCLSYITRGADRHEFIQLTVDIALTGDFDNAYSAGDNANVVPTDTMKNTVYAVARTHGVENIETFARHLAGHFYDSFDHVGSASVSVQQQLWQRIDIDGESHGHAFTGGGSEMNTCQVIESADATEMHSGLKGLQVLKTSGSGFSGFHRDPYTTLIETDDRIFATTITASWSCSDVAHDWCKTRRAIRSLLLDVFAHQFSPSVQSTLYEMAKSVLAACPEIEEISLDMPNQHHLSVDMTRLDMENRNDIFVPTPQPFGVISATVRRDS